MEQIPTCSLWNIPARGISHTSVFQWQEPAQPLRAGLSTKLVLGACLAATVSYPHLVMQEGFMCLAKGFSFPFQHPTHLSLEASPETGNVSSSVVRGGAQSQQDFPNPGSRRAARQLPHPSHFQPEAWRGLSPVPGCRCCSIICQHHHS